eukprot:m51a1_g7401 hypothetical protein (143) ;mRNA; r:173589-174017
MDCKSALVCVLALVCSARAVTYRKTADIQTSLIGGDTWTRFDAVTISFNTQLPRFATLQYTAGCAVFGYQSFMVTAMHLDGQVVPGSSVVNGQVYWHANTASVAVELPAGDHTLELWYRTPNAGTICPLSDWGGVLLSVVIP